MKNILIPIIITFYPLSIFPQIDSISFEDRLGRARNKPNADSTGHYELVALIDKTQINKGDSASVHIFITGYGQISQPKIYMSCSSYDILDKSYIVHSLGFISGERIYSWGHQFFSFDSLPVVLELSGGFVGVKNGIEYHLGQFIDANNSGTSTHIITEMMIRNPPAAVHLRFKKKARADNYKLNMYLTYFNGKEWESSIAVLDFRINNLIQEYEIGFGIIALIAALVGILPGIQITRRVVRRFFNYLNEKRAKKSKLSQPRDKKKKSI
jgi:hypothetical protein